MTTTDDAPKWRPLLLGCALPILEDRLVVARRLSLCLDFDGTLAPIVDRAEEASMPTRTRRALATLIELPSVDVAIVSGRGLSDLSARVPIEGCSLAGNHGLEIERNGDRWVHPAMDARRATLTDVVATLRERLESMPGCHLEDKRLTATVHHRNSSVDHETVVDLVESVLADKPDFEAVDGRKIVEVRPTIEWNKGDAVRRFAGDDAVVVYVGDDETDEDAFRALVEIPNPGVGILVGDRPSAATFRVHDVDGVRAFLEWLLETDAIAERSGRRGDPASAP